MSKRGISILIHGPAKVGKSTLADTAPAPRLFLDVEMGSDFTPSKKIFWDPIREKPPVPDGTWDTCVVYVREYDIVDKTYEWLNSGQHPFRSVILDSISEGQVRAKDRLAGPDGMDLKKWGKLLQQVGGAARKFRDLVTHPVKPIEAVVIIAMTQQRNGTGDWTPYVEGQLRHSLPYLYDMLAYLAKPVRNQDGSFARLLYTGPVPGYDAGGRFEQLLPHVIDNPNITDMLQRIREGADQAKGEVA